MCVDKLTIKSNIRMYDVFFEKNDDFLKKISLLENAVYVIDENVWNLYKHSHFSTLEGSRVIIQPVSEDVKVIDTVCELYSKIMDFSPRKNINLISIGGGILQDITGFVAASLYRGINWIFIPTTLLAQADSCIGAKTSLNFKHFKNLIGTFYPPSEIYIYPDFLKTLQKKDFYSGVGEMAKLHLISSKSDTFKFVEDLPLIGTLNNDILLRRIKNCLAIKKSYIEDDEFDTGKRNMLNYGHCFGHAIESATDFAIPHGQAIILGMILANKYALKTGILSDKEENIIEQTVLKPSLVVNIPRYDSKKVIQAMRHDKKNIGNGLALIMMNDNHEMIKLTDVQEEEAYEVLEQCLKSNCPII